MCRKDRTEKYLETYPEVFADVFNVLLYEAEVLRPENLIQGPTEAVYKAESGALNEQRRDIAKYYMENGGVTALLGIENQTEIDGNMPIRVLGYDYMSYKTQLHNRGKVYPVTTIVLNFGDRQWDMPLSLRDTVHVYSGSRFGSRVQDYGLYVFDIAYLPEEIKNRFTSDFRVIADFFSQKREGNYTPTDIKIKHVEAVLNMLRVFTKDERFGEAEEILLKKQRKGEVISMCTIIDTYIEKGREEGIKIGMEQGMGQGEKRGVLALYEVGCEPSRIAEMMLLSADRVNIILKENGYA